MKLFKTIRSKSYLKEQQKMKLSKTIRRTLGVVMASGLMSVAGIAAAAAPTPSATTVTNLQGVVTNGISLMDSVISGALVVAVVIGVIMIISGIMALKAASHDMQGQSRHPQKAVINLVGGALLVAIPSFLTLTDNSLGIAGATGMSPVVVTTPTAQP
jgi:uncharacterized membrane protein HdeD (DUF308 family)